MTAQFPWAPAIVVCLLSVPIAFALDDALHAKTHHAKPYTWGYYVGLSGTAGSIWFACELFGAAISSYGNGVEVLSLAGLFCLASGVAHALILGRNRLGWVVAVASHLNPLSWIINGIYLINRWTELDGLFPLSNLGAQALRCFKTLKLAHRVIVTSSFMWLVAVLAYTSTFSPFGADIRDDEWAQLLKVIVFPPAIIAVGFVLFEQLLSEDNPKE